jgi:probable F420-dependent oxidoreductase
MKFGITIPNSGHLATRSDLRVVAQRVEELGFDSVWVTDHVLLPLENESVYPYSADGRVTWDTSIDWLDCFVALTWVAAATSRVGLGTSVLILPMRPTLLVANLAASLNHLAPGRLTLGLGTGWLEEEFVLLGQSFTDRGPRMTEAVKLLRAAWTPGPVEFDGRFHASIPFAMEPSPASDGAIRVLIGGHSNPALKRVAAVGDGWHPTNLGPEQLEERLSYLDGQLEGWGRTRHDIQLVVRPGGNTLVTPRLAQQYQDLGVEELVLDVDWRGLSLAAALEEAERLADELGVRAPGG